MKILVVDDEEGVLQSTQYLLEELGYDVVTTSEHENVLEVLHDARPDLILQDVRMPGLDLREHVARIRDDPDVGGTPILLFSATLELPEIQERVNVEGILEKPFSPEELVEAIEETTRRAETARR